jgi:hypothetical protein
MEAEWLMHYLRLDLATLVKNMQMVAYFTNQILKITLFWDMMPCTVWWTCINISD